MKKNEMGRWSDSRLDRIELLGVVVLLAIYCSVNFTLYSIHRILYNLM